MSGSLRSINTTSKSRALTCSTAASPVDASVARWPTRSSSPQATIAFTSLSSTTRTSSDSGIPTSSADISARRAGSLVWTRANGATNPNRLPSPRRLCAHISTSQPLDEATADGETQPAPAEAPCDGGVGLHEGVENRLQPVGRNADAGVENLETQPDAVGVVVARADGQPNFASFGEFDGVADEVEQDLAELSGISSDGGKRGESRTS